MPSIEYKGQQLELDEDGFLQDPALWNEEMALFFAPMESVPEMTEDHWKIVRHIRDYYDRFGIAPMIRKISKETGIPVKTMYQLFPTGLDKGACRIAGLPKPTGCV